MRLTRLSRSVAGQAVIVTGAWCGLYGWGVGHPLMVLVAVIGIVSMLIQQLYIWRPADPPRTTYVGEHFRALIGMGISAYTAFLSVGLIRLLPEHVFNPAIWAGPSVVGVSLIIWFTLKAKRDATPKASDARPHPQ